MPKAYAPRGQPHSPQRLPRTFFRIFNAMYLPLALCRAMRTRLNVPVPTGGAVHNQQEVSSRLRPWLRCTLSTPFPNIRPAPSCLSASASTARSASLLLHVTSRSRVVHEFGRGERARARQNSRTRTKSISNNDIGELQRHALVQRARFLCGSRHRGQALVRPATTPTAMSRVFACAGEKVPREAVAGGYRATRAWQTGQQTEEQGYHPRGGGGGIGAIHYLEQSRVPPPRTR
jgi:hypothetical protein